MRESKSLAVASAVKLDPVRAEAVREEVTFSLIYGQGWPEEEMCPFIGVKNPSRRSIFQESGRVFCVLPLKRNICIYRYLLYSPSGKGFSRPSTLGHNPVSSIINPMSMPMWEWRWRNCARMRVNLL